MIYFIFHVSGSDKNLLRFLRINAMGASQLMQFYLLPFDFLTLYNPHRHPASCRLVDQPLMNLTETSTSSQLVEKSPRFPKMQ
jgi:hypothetical protein